MQTVSRGSGSNPDAVRRAMEHLGEHSRSWRMLNGAGQTIAADSPTKVLPQTLIIALQLALAKKRDDDPDVRAIHELAVQDPDAVVAVLLRAGKRYRKTTTSADQARARDRNNRPATSKQRELLTRNGVLLPADATIAQAQKAINRHRTGHPAS